MAKSLDDVVMQMRGYGLEPPLKLDLKMAFTKVIRWKPDGQKGAKKSAWMRLHSWTSPETQVEYISGAFGRGMDVFRVEASSSDWTPAERAAEMEARRAAAKAAEVEREKEGEAAAAKARKLWDRAREGSEGPLHPYLERKKVGAFGVKTGYGNILYVPLRNVKDELQGIQYISADGQDKKFGTGVVKEGHFHLVGEVKEGLPIAFGEGYATCASGHMATGWPVVACFDAGNLELVMGEWRKLYPDHTFVILADDDRHLVQRLAGRLFKHGISIAVSELKVPVDLEWDLPTGRHVECRMAWKADANGGPMRLEGTIKIDEQSEMVKLENAGMAKAAFAAKRHKARVLAPVFPTPDHEGTDWNDFHLVAGLEATREALLKAFDAPVPEKKRAGGAPQGDGKKAAKEQPSDPNFLERFTLIYGTTTVWDAREQEIYRIEAVKAAYGRLVDWWQFHDDRKIVVQSNVVFDPTGKVAKMGTHINLFGGLPFEPNPKGNCDLIVRHLMNLCGEDDALFHWVASWLALPLQRLGTKMRTSLIIHGRMEGTGKSLMMDVMRRIYGRYSRSITQVQLISEFNGWQSGMLFCVAEEVVSASERKNLKNLIQNMITNEVVQINEKNMPVREEQSYANFAFLSNEQLPMLLNETDRRYTVIQVETRHDPAYFAAIGEQMANGGIEAFYHWLLNYDLQGFTEFTLPFETKARLHLITLGMAPDQRFVRYWAKGQADLPFCTCTARDLYTAFRSWCRVNGERFICNNTQFGRTVTEALDRMGAPAKKSVRWDGFSASQVDKNDFSGVSSAQQSVVYFVPATVERVTLSQNETADEGKEQINTVDTAVVNRRIKAFQYRLGPLIDQARRAF